MRPEDIPGVTTEEEDEDTDVKTVFQNEEGEGYDTADSNE